MKEFKLKNRTINLCSWNDITLKQYIEYSKVVIDLSKATNTLEKFVKTNKLVEILCNLTEEEVDEIVINDMNLITEDIMDMISNMNYSDFTNHFNIDGIEYATKDTNELNNAEYISLNMIREQYIDSFDSFPRLLAVLIRPAKKLYDEETKQDKWVVEKFNKNDIDNLEFRANLFINKALAKDVAPPLSFFLNSK